MIHGPRTVTPADVDWVVDLAARRREQLARFAPRFWKPAPEGQQAHRGFLAGLIQSPDVVSIRTEHGFLLGVPDRGRLVIDDMAVDDESRWPTDGDLLLRQAATTGWLRVVCPLPETSRRAAVADLGLSIAETWWHRDLDPDPTAIEHRPGSRLTIDGADAVLTTAPPIYSPGGPVVLVRAAETTSALREIEVQASKRGCVVAVVAQQPNAALAPHMLETSGYKRTTEFLEGSVR